MDTSNESYLAPAFFSQYNLILLGGCALFSLASASPLPLLVGLVAEACWLSLGPKLPAFRRSVEAQLEADRRQLLEDAVLSGMRELDASQSARLASVTQALSLFALDAEAARDGDAVAAAQELEPLRATFLRLCQLQQRLNGFLQDLAQRRPEQEVARLSQAYAAEKDLGARLTLHQAIKLEQRKLEQQARLGEVGRNIELKLALIEQALGHLRGQQRLGATGATLARDARGLLAQIGTTAGFEAELAEAAPPIA